MIRKASVRSKLFFAIFGPSVLVLLILGALGLWLDVYTLRDALEREASVQANLLALSVRGPLSLEDDLAVRENLAALGGDQNIVGGAIYSPEHKLLITHLNDPTHEFPKTPEPGVQGRTLAVVREIKMGNELLGRLLVQVSLQRYYNRLAWYFAGTVSALLILTSMAGMIAGTLRRRMAEPLEVLSNTAQQISIEKDYRVRAPNFEEHEFDTLTNALNHMLQEIDKQNQSVTAANAQLRAANKELEAFTYSVSHDLRTPLRAISSYAQVMFDVPDQKYTAEATDYLERIQRNAAKMAQLIDDLLAFSKVDAHGLEIAEVDVETLVRGVIADVSAGNPKTQFTVEPLPKAQADAALLRQVFWNLIGNAAKYSRTRDPAKVVVGSMQKDGMSAYYVRDNGVGFSMEYYSKLFGVFQRLHSEMQFEGTGVGLAIVHRIVTRHGGRVWAESEPDKGATFYFTLP